MLQNELKGEKTQIHEKKTTRSFARHVDANRDLCHKTGLRRVAPSFRVASSWLRVLRCQLLPCGLRHHPAETVAAAMTPTTRARQTETKAAGSEARTGKHDFNTCIQEAGSFHALICNPPIAAFKPHVIVDMMDTWHFDVFIL